MIQPLPATIKVAAFDIRIIDWGRNASAASRSYGEFSSLELVIRVDTGVDKIKVVDTLLHELNHAIYWAYGMDNDDKEERIVATMATAWTQVYRDNPQLLIWIWQMTQP